eukprot:s7757_g4.t1
MMSVLLPGTRSGGTTACRFDHPDQHSNGPMSSLRMRMNNWMIETSWTQMTKAERLFLTKGNWHVEWRSAHWAKENATDALVNVYDWLCLPIPLAMRLYNNGIVDLSRSRIICGVGASCTPLLFAWTARAYSGVQEVAAAQVRLNTMRSLGTFIGPFGSTLLCVLPKEGLFNELNSAGWAIAAANLFGVVLCCYRLTDPAVPSEPRVSAAERGQHGQPPVTAARSFPTTPVIWTCLLFQVTTALLLAVLEVVPPIVLTDEFRLPPAATSILFGIASLAVIALFALVEVLSRKVSGRSLMTAGVLLVSCGALWAQTSWKLGSSFLDFVLPWLVLAVAPAPLLRTPARTLYTSHLPKHVQGTMQGISEAAFSFANFVGPILGSHVATSGGFEGLRLTMLGLVVAEVLLLCVGFSRLVPGTEL